MWFLEIILLELFNKDAAEKDTSKWNEKRLKLETPTKAVLRRMVFMLFSIRLVAACTKQGVEWTESSTIFLTIFF